MTYSKEKMEILWEAIKYIREADGHVLRMRKRDWFHLCWLHFTSKWRTRGTLAFIFQTVMRVAVAQRVTIRGKTAGFVLITRRGKEVFSLDAYVCSRSRFALTVAPACAIWVLWAFEYKHPGVPVYASIDRSNRAARHTLKAAGFLKWKSHVVLNREVWRYG